MRQRFALLPVEDDDREVACRQCAAPVKKAQPPRSARCKAQTRRIPVGLPENSFRTLIDDLASVVVNVIPLPGARPLSRGRPG